jgi:circadian clock protein KaiC
MEKISTGIEGLDEMLEGGIPKGHVVAVVGAYGTGKSTFGLQFINEGLKNGEKAMFLSLEEDLESILETARSFDWDFQRYMDENKLAVFKIEPGEAATATKKIQSEFPEYIRSFGATRFVLDSASLLEMTFDTKKEARVNLFSLAKMIKSAGATAIFTAEADPNNPHASKDGIVEYTADGVILLSYEVSGGEVQLNIRVIKMRRTSHWRDVKPYEITDNGIVVKTTSAVF